jgi:predicted O-methyltransferase YrrM
LTDTDIATKPVPKAYSYADWITYQTHAEIDFLMELARELPDNPRVVNIGAGVGTSGLAFLESREDLIYFSVDIRGEENPIGGLVNERHAFEAAGYWDTRQITQLQGDSKDVGRGWVYGLVDMVYIDGDHTHEGCMGDWLNWKNHIKPGGVVVFHDYKCVWGPGVETTVIAVAEEHEQIGLVDTTIAFRITDAE